MFIVVIAKKNAMINFKENTPPPRKSVYGYMPWKPSLSQCFPETSG
jgi:hypothetical protein